MCTVCFMTFIHTHTLSLHNLVGNGTLIMLGEVCHLLLITVWLSLSYPQPEAEPEPRGLAQCGRGVPVQRRHHLQDRTHRHSETGLL